MSKNLTGKKMPKFKANATSEKEISSADFENKNLVIYFYPKDSTPGCTTEGQDFRDNYKKFKKLNTEILGVSRDSIKSHENFKAKQSFPFELLSDPDEKVCKAFDVMKMKSMYGREYMGVDRSTFLINEKGKVVREWRSVKVKGHVRGKSIEIMIVGFAAAIIFSLFGLQYTALLSVLVGFSVLIPFLGAFIATIPVAIIGLLQFGLTFDFWMLIGAYILLQILDGNVLVPILFSDAVKLHPFFIILAVFVFGGIFGFWGVFIAIPIATFIKAVWNAWPSSG